MASMNFTNHAAATLLPGSRTSQNSSDIQSMYGSNILILDPWASFNRLFSKIMGYDAKLFKFVPGQTPMSTLRETLLFILAYYTVVLGGRELMQKRKPYKLNRLFIIHNFYLSVISGSLLLLFAQQLMPGIWKNGLFDGVCGATGWSEKLVVLYYLNYLTKYLELLDTVFLVLKKKPLTFLHTYHHGATAFLCYTQLVGETSVSWVPITLNLGVHVIMYWYYFQAARGVKIWWKQFITIFQILQFVLDLGFIYFASYTYFADTYAPWLPNMGFCGVKKQEIAAITGCTILTSYLALFIGFYFSTYKKASPKRALRRASTTEVPTASQTTEIATDALRSAKDNILESVKEEAGGM